MIILIYTNPIKNFPMLVIGIKKAQFISDLKAPGT